MFLVVYYLRLMRAIALDVIARKGSYDKVMGR